jgi:hypothetical protein
MNNNSIADILNKLKDINNSIVFTNDSKKDYKTSCQDLKKSKILNRINELLHELIILNNADKE